MQASQNLAERGRHRCGVSVVKRRRPVRLVDAADRFGQIAPAGELHLDRVHTRLRLPVMAGDVAPPKPPVGDAAERRRIARGFDRRCELGCTARSAVRADVEVRQHAFEQPRDRRTDRMAVIEHDLLVHAAQPLELGR